jgi:hypothetical protein
MIHLLLSAVVLLLAASPAIAHKPGDPPHQTYAMGDLKLETARSSRTSPSPTSRTAR